jgi:hypothetical protein
MEGGSGSAGGLRSSQCRTAECSYDVVPDFLQRG